MNSKAETSEVNGGNGSGDTWEAVESWILSKGESGEIVPSTARLKAGGLRSLALMLRPDEPKTPEYVFDNLPELARRRANLNPGNQSDTVRTYQGRGRWALEVYAKWKADPVSFRFPESKERPAKAEKPKARERHREEIPGPANDAATTPTAPKVSFRSFPLGDGREILFNFPDGPTIRELKKFFFHAVTFATDFDPSEPGQSQLYTLARRDD